MRGGRGPARDVLRFAALAKLLRHPRRSLAILWARLLGKRLRARQSLAALVGIEHRLWLPREARPKPEQGSALAAEDIDVLAVEALPAASSACASIVVLLGEGHDLVEGAGAAIAEAFRDDALLQALYGDALTQIAQDGPLLPLLRPAFDPDYLRSLDYVGPVVALRRSSLDAVGSDLTPGAASLDLLLRLDARFGAGAVRHLPRLLSFRRAGQGEDSSREGRLAAVRLDLDRRGERNAGIGIAEDGIIHVERPLPEPHPLVSLIVPTRDRLDLLKTCIASLVERTDWPEKEILICDNDSREAETLAYLRGLGAQGLARVIACPGPFDFAAMNNAAAAAARGGVLAFVNNDVEAFRPDWLGRMVREALRPDVGAVGAKLLDGAGHIQHAGIVLGTGGLVTHGHRHFRGDAPGYLGALGATHRVSAVTAACLVVEAAKFGQVGGFDASRFAVDFNDVDLCLRLDADGWRSLLVPSSVLHHREAASRRKSAVADARHRAEVSALRETWGPLLAQDPRYHPGFDPDLSTHARLRPGWTGLDPALPR